MPLKELLRREWRAFRRPGRLIALAAAALAVIAVGLLYASGNHASCAGPCRHDPTSADGSVVGDRFWFLHRGLGRNGAITVRLTAMTGTITYPPPHHDQIVPGLVPWAKTGIIIKDGVRPGSSYAALAMTGHHGVRMQHDYRHDIAGSPDGVSPRSPRWLRLTRSGATVTGAESADGLHWRTVGTVELPNLPDTAQVGLFATSPGDLTLRKVGLGGAVEETRFTQATGVFDHVTTAGASAGAWRSEAIGGMNQTDWEKYHNASGAIEKGGAITVSGTGDIGPSGDEGVTTVGQTLPGLVIALIIIPMVAARYGAKDGTRDGTRPDAAPGRRRAVVIARAVVVGGATFVTGLAAVGIVLPVGVAILRHNGVPVQPVSALTAVRVVLGVAAALAMCGVLAYGLGAVVRRGWAAVVLALTLVAVPYAVATMPLLPDAVARWLLRLTPAAGFAVQQTRIEYPQVVAHYAPSAGYFPLPLWAGFAVLCAYALAGLWRATTRAPSHRPTNWR